MKKTILAICLLTLTGCSTIQKYWPRDHDPVAFGQLVDVSLALDTVDCKNPNWIYVVNTSARIAKNAQWRDDPQADNLMGLHNHATKMNQGGSETFCELGKKTAQQRIDAVKSAWSGR